MLRQNLDGDRTYADQTDAAIQLAELSTPMRLLILFLIHF